MQRRAAEALGTIRYGIFATVLLIAVLYVCVVNFMQYLYFFAELGKEKSVTLTNATAEDISKHIEALGKAQ